MRDNYLCIPTPVPCLMDLMHLPSRHCKVKLISLNDEEGGEKAQKELFDRVYIILNL